MDAASRSALLRLLVAVGFLLGLGAFIVFGGTHYLSLDVLAGNRTDLVAWCDEHAVSAVGLFVIGYGLAVAFSVPGGVLLTITGGFLFGALLGTIAAVVGATAGASAVFLAARYVAGDILRRRAEGAVRRMERGFRRNAFSYLLFLRLVPLFPFWLVNLVPAFLGVPFRIYLLTTIIGIIPGALVYSLVGDGLGAILDAGGEPDLDIIFEPKILAPMLGLALLSLLPVLWRGPDGADPADAAQPAADQRENTPR